MGGSINGGTTIAGWFIVFITENPVDMGDLGVPHGTGNIRVKNHYCHIGGNNTRWCPPSYKWFIHLIKYRYIPYKP
jgi:hypothetical protein